MDIANLAPDIAKLLGLQPSTLVLLLIIVKTAANIGARKIPDDATGWLGVVRKVCSVIGLYVPSTITSGVTTTDIAKASYSTPPITEKAETEGETK